MNATCAVRGLRLRRGCQDPGNHGDIRGRNDRESNGEYARRKASRPSAGPQRPPAQPQQPPQQQPQLQAQADRPKSVKEEIDEFLRRAAQKKQSQTMPLLPQRIRAKASHRRPTRRISQPSADLSTARNRSKPKWCGERPVGGAVSEHVNKYLDEKEFDQRASKLGGDVAAADTKIEQHLKEVFGHGISQLAAKPGETAAPPTPPSTGFFQDEVPVLAAAGTGLACC